MAEAHRKPREEPPVSKVLEDRVRPDPELVGQVLDPGRTAETVQYPDPKAPDADDGGGADSVAEVQMARRTDAGARQPGAGAYTSGGVLLWFVAVAAVALVLLVFASI